MQLLDVKSCVWRLTTHKLSFCVLCNLQLTHSGCTTALFHSELTATFISERLCIRCWSKQRGQSLYGYVLLSTVYRWSNNPDWHRYLQLDRMRGSFTRNSSHTTWSKTIFNSCFRMAISTGMEALKNDGERSEFLCLSPTPIATMETDANVASKIYTTSPLPSAPTLGNFPAPPAIGSQNERSVVYKEQKQHPQAPLPKSHSMPKQQSAESAKAQKANKSERKDEKEHVILRSGKWTAVEEAYANILIELFEEGRIDEYEKRMDSDGYNNNNDSKDESKPAKFKIENGMTLRFYLSRKLFCSPMRISKKFAGRGIGKLVYMSQRPGSFYRIRQRFGLSSGPMSSNPTPVVWSANDWNKLNRLKEAESNFLILAFPQQQVGHRDATMNYLQIRSSVEFMWICFNFKLICIVISCLFGTGKERSLDSSKYPFSDKSGTYFWI